MGLLAFGQSFRCSRGEEGGCSCSLEHIARQDDSDRAGLMDYPGLVSGWGLLTGRREQQHGVLLLAWGTPLRGVDGARGCAVAHLVEAGAAHRTRGARTSYFGAPTPVSSGTGQPNPRSSPRSSSSSSVEWGSDGGRIGPIDMPMAAITAFLRRAWPPDRTVIFW